MPLWKIFPPARKSTDPARLSAVNNMNTLLVVWLAATGLSFGSFANVLIHRLPRGQSLLRPGSRCPQCGHPLAWYENIPVLSFVAQRGRCRSCKKPISARYPLVELLMGTLFLACLRRFGWEWPLIGALVFVILLLPLVFIDAREWILPWELTIPGIALGLLLHIPQGTSAFAMALIGAAAGFLAFRLIELLGWGVTGHAALGGGDKFLLAMCGATLGYRSLLGVVTLSAVQGATWGIVQLLRTGRAGPATPASHSGERAMGRERWTPAFLRSGLGLATRIALIPYALLLQEVPDPPPADASEAEPEWQPGATTLPYGPWIGLAAIQVMLWAPQLASALDHLGQPLWGFVLFGVTQL